jgi:MerR family transcriptional regulator, activator of bmr gene
MNNLYPKGKVKEMKGDLFLIGEIAALSGISAKALRFYERLGLVAPHFIDPQTKYRYYSRAQLVRLDIIRASRSMGLGLKEIKAILEAKDGEALLGLLETQKKSAAEKIRELQRTVLSIDSAKAAIAESLSPIGERGVFVKDMPERLLISRMIGSVPSLKDVAIEYAKLERTIKERKLVHRYETGIMLAPDENSGFRPSAVFIVVGAEEDSDSAGLSIIPAGRFFCVRYAEANAVARQAKLNAYLRRKGLEPVLILQSDMLSDLFSFGSGQAELQVLAKKTG